MALHVVHVFFWDPQEAAKSCKTLMNFAGTPYSDKASSARCQVGSVTISKL